MQPIQDIRARLDADLNALESQLAAGGKGLAKAFEDVKVKYQGKKGDISGLLRSMGALPPEQRPEFGKLVNDLRDYSEERFSALQGKIKEADIAGSLAGSTLDATLPGYRVPQGSLHPMSQVREEIITFFQGLGFELAGGPEVDNDWYNFEALNIPPDHPSRDMHDTFYVDDQVVLRTHTSNVQAHYMETHRDPPIRIIAPGFVYRVDNDATHSPMFQQVECLVVDKGISFAHLKGTLFLWARHMFGEKTTMRFRPSYFPFTEPSAEVDIRWDAEDGTERWLEVLGCGMVHPTVLKNCGIDPERYTGFAFGLGVERFAMLRYGVGDLRAFFENDLRFLRQFA